MQVAGEEIVEDSAGNIAESDRKWPCQMKALGLYSANDGEPRKILSKDKMTLHPTILVCYCFEGVI